MKIAISGKSGCGNSTVSRLAAERLGLRVINYTFKNIAEERGIDFGEVCRLAEEDPSFDLEVDRKQIEMAAAGDCVLGSRLAIWLLEDADLRVYLDASIETRAGRIRKREGGDLTDAIVRTRDRDRRDHDRYMRLYGIDNDDPGIADMVIDTETIDEKGVADLIVAEAVSIAGRTGPKERRMTDGAMAKAYDPKDFEDRIYAYWMENGFFTPGPPSPDEPSPFVIVIPPPNVTGVLHMGHGLNNCLQDIVIRYRRMKGVPTLWLPGTDHAGIATQNVVERKLRERGVSRRDLGRDGFVEEAWKVTEEHKRIILKQLQKIGSSCDWTRERFTFDEGLSRAVREVFVTLYERGLVYRGNYLVNWCPSCGTALSDDEVEHGEVKGQMYRYRYPLADGSGSVTIATTRPETMLGDTAVAVHPDDERYAGLIGRELSLPLTGRTIPIIADSAVDREFGTGAVKVTPGHDQTDWEIGERHGLEKINILAPDGTLTNVPDRYAGLDTLRARELVVADLAEQGLFIDETDHVHQVGHCYRCDTLIQPYLSDQWFVSMRGMADKALAAWERGEVRFFPKRWENTYAHWLRTIRDWCISRQLWWGHRIPVWYCDDCGEVIVPREDPVSCPRCGSARIRQDEDVLDTWFSSWLWPFSTLGWPDETEDLRRFFPTTTLVTAYDIIFFWVSRMIMAGLEFMGEVPFRDIYITGLVRDIKGRKMSKSLGNGVDPLEIVDEFGADAMKFTLGFLAAQGQDVLLEKETFRVGSKFANKIWNAARFLILNFEGRTLLGEAEIERREIDRWIFHRLNGTVRVVDEALQNYRFNEAAQAIYEFFWNDFCDWYIEAAKLSLYSGADSEKDRIASLLYYVLEESLRLLHPFLPFITEEIYGKLPGAANAVMTSAYPVARADRECPETAERFAGLQELVRGVRTLRSEFTVPPEKKIRMAVRVDDGYAHRAFLSDNRELIILLTNASEVTFEDVSTDGSVPVAGNGFEVHVFVKDAVDVGKELVKLGKELDSLTKLISATGKKLSNPQFLERAPADVVEKERSKLSEFEERAEKITRYVADLSGAR